MVESRPVGLKGLRAGIFVSKSKLSDNEVNKWRWWEYETVIESLVVTPEKARLSLSLLLNLFFLLILFVFRFSTPRFVSYLLIFSPFFFALPIFLGFINFIFVYLFFLLFIFISVSLHSSLIPSFRFLFLLHFCHSFINLLTMHQFPSHMIFLAKFGTRVTKLDINVPTSSCNLLIVLLIF
jgi:hypothetical protein